MPGRQMLCGTHNSLEMQVIFTRKSYLYLTLQMSKDYLLSYFMQGIEFAPT